MLVLNDLDAVDWSRSTHAHGAATDVPDLLRALADGSRTALSDLYGTIWHQGTVYEATGHAVPFLIRILDAPAADLRAVLGLLASIAEGSSYLYVHQRFLPRSKRDSDETVEQMDTELGWVAAARQAVAAGTPAYLRLLATDPNEHARAAAAHLIGVLGLAGADEEGAAGLRRAAADDTSDLVRAAAVLSLATFTASVTDSLTDPAPLPRLAAALVTLQGRGDTNPSAEIEALALVIERDAPDCLNLVDRLPTGMNNALAWVVEATVPHWTIQIRLLTTWLHHPSRTVRELAAMATTMPLQTWRPAAGQLAPALIEAQRDPVEAVRERALWQLTRLGRSAAGAADLLWAVVERGPLGAEEQRKWSFEPSLGVCALVALTRLHDPRADAYLADLLRGRPLRLAPGLDEAVDALRPWAVACREAVIDAIEQAPAGYARARLIRAAGRLGAAPAELVPVLRRQLAEHPRSAGGLLGDLGPVAAAVLPELIAVRAGADPSGQIAAARALWRITGEVDDLLGLLRDRIGDSHALEILAEVGPAVGPAAAGLAELLPSMFDGDDEWRAVRSAIAYWHLTGDAEPVVPVLVRYIASVPWGVLTVRALADIGPAAAAAIPALQAHAESPYRHGPIAEDEGWATVCAYALARIRGAEPTCNWPDVPLPQAAQRP